MHLHVALILTAGTMLIGCGDHSGAESPQALFDQALAAAERRDADALIRLIDPSTQEGQVVSRMILKGMTLSAAIADMRRAAQAKFPDTDLANRHYWFRQLTPDLSFAERFKDAQLLISGDTAVVQKPGALDFEASMIQKNHRWYLHPSSIFRGDEFRFVRRMSRYMENVADSLVPVFSDQSIVEQATSVEDFEQRLTQRLVQSGPGLELLESLEPLEHIEHLEPFVP